VPAENLTAAVVLPTDCSPSKSLPPRPVWLKIVVASVKKRLVKDLKGTTNDGN
jgi:hypothetical protein